MNPTELERLRARAVAGEAPALELLCQALEAPLFRLCLRMLGNASDAEDAAQDILVKVVTHLSQFEGRSALTTWVHQLAVRHVLALKSGRAELLATDEEGFAALLDQGLAWGQTQPPAPDDRVLLREVRLTCTQAMLLMLSRDERLAVVLVELLGFDGAEAAVIAGVSHDAFRQRLSRARTRLGSFLESKCGLVNEAAACRCDRQLPAKQALGMKVRLGPLCTDERPAVTDDVLAAEAEMRHLRVISSAFHRDGLFAAPARLHERLKGLLPSVL
jgi:RNA polymerase sigma factor (sigma-70 family)